ncbi:MAG: prolipoprotein diacylglyceryl transferase [Bdellovibrionota bacterium]
MHPLLLSIGPINIYSYGVMIFIAFVVSLSVAKKLASKNGISPKQYEDIAIWGLLVGLLGAKLLYLITRLDEIFLNPSVLKYYITSGFVFYGALLTIIPFLIYVGKKYKFSVLKYLDIFMVVLPLGHSIGRIGCFLAGCCHGKPTNMPWGVKLYSDIVEPSLKSVSIHPVQLYESFSLFILFIILYKLYQKRDFDGKILSLYFILYGIIRFIMEEFRGDGIRGFVIENVISTSQFISIIMLVSGIFCFYYFKNKYSYKTK